MTTHPCPKCGQESPFRLRPDTQHHGEIRCAVHGHAWISKPDELKTPRRADAAAKAADCVAKADNWQAINPPALLERLINL